MTDSPASRGTGYTVAYPDEWYTNTVIGDVRPCSWFSPTYFDVIDPAVPPDEIAIFLGYFDGATGSNEPSSCWASRSP